MKRPDSPTVAPAHPRGGRAVAWIGFVFGSVISTAGNVLYTWIPPEGAPPGWTPTLTAQLFAAVWPIALLLSVEVLSRVRWAPGWQWAAARYGGAGTVAVGSGVISYGHLYGVLDAWKYGTLGAGVGPLVLDGLMVVSGFALLSPAPDRTGVLPSYGGRPAASDVLPPAGPAILSDEPASVLQDASHDASPDVSVLAAPAPSYVLPAPSCVPSAAVLSCPDETSYAGQGQDAGQDAAPDGHDGDDLQDGEQDAAQDGQDGAGQDGQDAPPNTETDPVRWAAFELSAGRSAGYVVLGRRFPDLSERKAKEAAKAAREEQDAGLRVVRTA